ncbi:MAG: FkbM family methyltransferase [Victivallales bacterium]
MTLHDLYKKYSSGLLDKHRYIELMHKKHLDLFDYYDYIKETDIQSITIANDSIYVTVRGSNIKLLLDKYDRRFIPIEILNFHTFDPEERNLLYKIAGRAKTIFDIGANIGWYTLNFALLDERNKVYSFEPIPYTYDYLNKHIKLNKVRNAISYNIGFSDTIEDKIFYWSKDETGSSSMQNIQKRSEANKIKCKITTLDHFMSGKNINIDLIKCDVEGAELFVFKGGLETIKKQKPIIFTEMLRKWSRIFGYHPNDIITLLRSIGYECYIINKGRLKKFGLVDDETIQTNYFFLHTKKHAKLISELTAKK